MDPLADALAMALRKRGLLDADDNQQLMDHISGARQRDVRGMRRWCGRSLMPQAWLAVLEQLMPKDMPEAFGAFTCLCHLAQGGMGDVWLAHGQGRLVVVKTIRPELSCQMGFAKRFQREVRILGRVRDDHIVASLSEGLTPDRMPFLVLEAVPGPDLKVLTREHGHLPEAVALHHVRDACRGLLAVHRAGFIHRDIKPANILIDETRGLAKLSDFGIARSTREDRSRLTQPGDLMGSHHYMSPEQVETREDLDIRADIYGLGCVLHSALAGRPPFSGSMAEVMRCHCQEGIPEIRSIRAEVGADVAAIIRRCMAKERTARFADPTLLLAALDAAITARTPATPPDSDAAARLAVDENAPTATAPTPAMAGPFLDDRRITLDGIGHPLRVVLCAGPSMVMGKLVDPGVDICLREHPIVRHRERLQRISRRHLAIRRDAAGTGIVLEDLGTDNGTWLDGKRLPRDGAAPLAPDTLHDLRPAQTLRLAVRCHAVEQARGSTITAVTVHRSDNRPELAYALVLEMVTIGHPDAQLPIQGTDRLLAFKPPGGMAACWMLRIGNGPWSPVTPDAVIDLGNGMALSAHTFDDGHLADDP